MKKIIILTIVLLLNINCNSQNDIIGASSLTINNLTVLDKEKSFLLQNFGQPLSIEQEYLEMDNINAEKYLYSGILFYLVENKVYSFQILNNTYSITAHKIKIGDNINILQNIYPISYSNKKNGLIAINIIGYDRYIGIRYNSNNIIQKILLYNY